jgi:hypothetical protein
VLAAARAVAVVGPPERSHDLEPNLPTQAASPDGALRRWLAQRGSISLSRRFAVRALAG